MKAYLLIHDYGDYDSRPEVRGAYVTEELAQEALTVHEVSYGENERVGPWTWFREHTEDCCYVTEHDLQTEVQLAYHGPSVPRSVRFPNERPEHVVPNALVDALTRQIGSRNPLQSLFGDTPATRVMKVPDGSGAQIKVLMHHDMNLPPIIGRATTVVGEQGIEIVMLGSKQESDGDA